MLPLAQWNTHPMTVSSNVVSGQLHLSVQTPLPVFKCPDRVGTCINVSWGTFASVFMQLYIYIFSSTILAPGVQGPCLLGPCCIHKAPGEILPHKECPPVTWVDTGKRRLSLRDGVWSASFRDRNSRVAHFSPLPPPAQSVGTDPPLVRTFFCFFPRQSDHSSVPVRCHSAHHQAFCPTGSEGHAHIE